MCCKHKDNIFVYMFVLQSQRHHFCLYGCVTHTRTLSVCNCCATNTKTLFVFIWVCYKYKYIICVFMVILQTQRHYLCSYGCAANTKTLFVLYGCVTHTKTLFVLIWLGNKHKDTICVYMVVL